MKMKFILDIIGIIKFWKRNEEKKIYIQIKNKYILSPNPNCNDVNILLVNDILVVGNDKLYFSDINEITLIIKKNLIIKILILNILIIKILIMKKLIG